MQKFSNNCSYTITLLVTNYLTKPMSKCIIPMISVTIEKQLLYAVTEIIDNTQMRFGTLLLTQANSMVYNDEKGNSHNVWLSFFDLQCRSHIACV